jgi:hypothetical protein
MPLCNDPFLTYLKNEGYSVVRLPRADFRPLQILADQGKELTNLGDITHVMSAGPKDPLPQVQLDAAVPSISGKNTSNLSLGIGLSILGTILGAMGAGTLGLDVTYSRAKTLAFAFQDVLMDSVQIAALDRFLGGADVNPQSKGVGQLLESDDIYVVTSTIKSKKITVVSAGSGGTAVKVDVPMIKGIVGATVKVSADGDQSSQVTYEGAQALVFGFQAVQLFYDEGHYSAFEPLPTGTMVANLVANQNDVVHALERPGPFIRVSGTPSMDAPG